jgi:hypothetical protein
MGIEHLLAHLAHFLAQAIGLAPLTQHLTADGGKSVADLRIASAETGPGQRLMFPQPGSFALVLAESVKRGDDQPAGVCADSQVLRRMPRRE